MTLQLIILIALAILAVVGYFLLGKFAKGVRMVLSSVLLIILISFTAYLSWDSKQVQDHFATDSKMFVYVQDDTLWAAFENIQDTTNIKADAGPQRTAYAANDLKQLKGTSYKVLILKSGAFDHVTNINVSGVIITHDQALDIIVSKTPRTDFLQMYADHYDINSTRINQDSLGSDDTIRGVMFATLVGEAGKNDDIMLRTRTGDLTIYPDSITFWLIRNVPDEILPYVVKGKTA